MTLSALLQLLRVSILGDRSDRTAGTSDYLWTDETLVTYINEAQRRFAVRGLVLRDATTDEVTKIPLVAGQSEYALHQSVLAVVSAKNVDQVSDLARVGHGILNTHRTPTETWIDPASLAALPSGPTLAFATDEGLQLDDNDGLGSITLRIYPTPAAAQAGDFLRLRVIRKPIEELVHTQLGASPEIPADYHIEMLDWAAYLALRIVDDDAGSPKRADEFRKMFETHVKAARNDVMRKMFAPIDWGFGRGGFNWSN